MGKHVTATPRLKSAACKGWGNLNVGAGLDRCTQHYAGSVGADQKPLSQLMAGEGGQSSGDVISASSPQSASQHCGSCCCCCHS